jgi:hypothetical protein
MAHRGRCSAWYRAHPEFHAEATEKLRAMRRARGQVDRDQPWQPSAVHVTPEWTAAARKLREALVAAVLNGFDPVPWAVKLRKMIEME